MARTEARIFVNVWKDQDFRALSRSAQGTYFFLTSQPDLHYTGVIPLRDRPWARTAAGYTLDALTSDLEELAALRFIVIDYDEMQLLVRTFIRSDKVFRQPNILRAAAGQVCLIESASLREALADELRIIAGLPDLPKDVPDIVEGMLAELAPPGNPSPIPSGRGSGGVPEGFSGGSESQDSAPASALPVRAPHPGAGPTNQGANQDIKGSQIPSEKGSEGVPGGFRGGSEGETGERGTVTTVTTASPSPYPLLPLPTSVGAAADDALEQPPTSHRRSQKRATRIPDDFDVTPEMVAWARERTPEVDGRRETEKFVNYWQAKSGKDATKHDWVATWRNWMLSAQERLPSRQRPAAGSVRQVTRDPDAFSPDRLYGSRNRRGA